MLNVFSSEFFRELKSWLKHLIWSAISFATRAIKLVQEASDEPSNFSLAPSTYNYRTKKRRWRESNPRTFFIRFLRRSPLFWSVILALRLEVLLAVPSPGRSYRIPGIMAFLLTQVQLFSTFLVSCFMFLVRLMCYEKRVPHWNCTNWIPAESEHSSFAKLASCLFVAP